MSAGWLAAAAVALSAHAARAEDRMEPLPKQLEGVVLNEKLGAQVPLELPFTDSNGRAVKLGDLVHGDRPAILTLNYSNCPMLCSLQLTGFVDMLKGMKGTPGVDFDVITVSLDPTEPVERTAKTKQHYLGRYGRPEADDGWHFLVGPETSVRALADSIGFGYRYDPETKEYMHGAVLTLLGPGGRVSRYLSGVVYDAETTRLSLLEANAGRTASLFDQAVLYCFQYDHMKGRYAPVAMNIMRLAGALTVLVLGIFLGAFWLRESRRKKVGGGPRSAWVGAESKP